MSDVQPPPDPRFDDALVERLLRAPEGVGFETKRAGDNGRKLETIVAFANTNGGLLVLGVDDATRAAGRDRVRGIGENPESIADLRRMLVTHVAPAMTAPEFLPPTFTEIGCTLCDGTRGSVVVVSVAKSDGVHSLDNGNTFVRVGPTNRRLTAPEIMELGMQRGVRSWVSGLVDVRFALLETEAWREYSGARHLSRPLPDALESLGLARREAGGPLLPTRAAVLLFADEPAGLLDSKCSIRLFHYRGDRIEHSAATNLLRPPKTIGGPIRSQIRLATDALVDALAEGVQMGPLGFEIVQKYPVRVLREAITNAVLHRDYRVSGDIQIRVFANRVEVESPGLLPGAVTVRNIRSVGSHPRNRALVDHLREFPQPPNLDAGEGVRMIYETLDRASLYPPIYLTPPDWPTDSVLFACFNEARPGIWQQVEAYLERHGDIGNAEVRRLLRTDDPVKASRRLRQWVDLNLLVVADPDAAKQHRRYRRPGAAPVPDLFSRGDGKQQAPTG